MSAGALAAGVTAGVVGALVAFTAASIRRAERLVPPDGRFLDVPGGRIHYTDEGQGRPIVLIHGLGGQMRNFAQPLVKRLAQGWRVIAIDRPGSGYSTVSGPWPDLNGQARMVAALIERLQLGPVVLAGHSLGGTLSLALVEQRPDLVASLALVSPLTMERKDAPTAFAILTVGSAAVRRLIGWTVLAPVGRRGSGKRRQPVFAPDPVPDDFESRGGGALLYRPRGFDAASRDMQDVPVTLPGICAGYGAIRRPVAVLFGRGDQILEPALHGQDFVTRVPGARLTLMEGGHMLPFTQPEATAAWIDKVGQEGAAKG